MKKVLMFVIPLILVVFGVTYAFFSYTNTGERNEIVTGQIYMNYTENSQIYITDMLPETKEEALARTEGGIFNFTIEGRNTSEFPLYYGIRILEGDAPEGKTVKLKPEHIMIYLERDGEVLIDGIRYSDWDNRRIWVETIPAGTNNNTTYNYQLRMWIDTEILISDTNPNRDYTLEDWNNAYASLKVGVDGTMETMNMPLSIETSDTYVENNKSYFIAKVSNFYDMNELGRSISNTDTMNLQITSDKENILFSYKDSEGNVVDETSKTLDLTYLFNKNKTIEIQVFMESENDANSVTDLNFKLTKNSEVIQNFYKYANIKGDNFCLNNGFNKLYDCILASDSLASDIETAKVNIANKGEPDLNTTAPTYTYVEVVTTNQNGDIQQGNMGMKLSTTYLFDNVTGTYYLENSFNDDLSDNYINYYTCGNHYSESCLKLYKILAIDAAKDSISLTKYDQYSSSIATTIRSEVGLYKTEDDYGNSYFYRGDVTNNNVAFGGYYWKIIRANGNGSIRMIYNGTSTTSTGNNSGIGLAKYNDYTHDPTYLGYMYGMNFELKTSKETNATVGTESKYYFSTDYEFNDTTKKFNMIGEMKQGTITEMKDLFETYPYTCLLTSENFTCNVIVNVVKYTNNERINVKYISYSSKNLSATREDNYDSNAKKVIDEWYKNNILNGKDLNGNNLTLYISDEIFCNDRETSAGDGYSLAPSTSYGSYYRLNFTNGMSPSLKCFNKNDAFTVNNELGNSKLTYPIALITADEVAFSGGKLKEKNADFFLNSKFWHFTMTPSYFSSDFNEARLNFLEVSGMLENYRRVSYEIGLRPVINIRGDVLISSGDGTTENPFQLKLS